MKDTRVSAPSPNFPKSMPKTQEQQKTVTEVPLSAPLPYSADMIDDGNNHEAEGSLAIHYLHVMTYDCFICDCFSLEIISCCLSYIIYFLHTISLAGEGYSIYIKNLPFNIPYSVVEEALSRFGPIKNDGIQIRKNNVRLKFLV